MILLMSTTLQSVVCDFYMASAEWDHQVTCRIRSLEWSGIKWGTEMCWRSEKRAKDDENVTIWRVGGTVHPNYRLFIMKRLQRVSRWVNHKILRRQRELKVLGNKNELNRGILCIGRWVDMWGRLERRENCGEDNRSGETVVGEKVELETVVEGRCHVV